MKRAHLGLSFLWFVFAIPTAIWWRHSIPLLVFVGIYDVATSHWGAYQSARAEKSGLDDDESKEVLSAARRINANPLIPE